MELTEVVTPIISLCDMILHEEWFGAYNYLFAPQPLKEYAQAPMQAQLRSAILPEKKRDIVLSEFLRLYSFLGAKFWHLHSDVDLLTPLCALICGRVNKMQELGQACSLLPALLQCVQKMLQDNDMVFFTLLFCNDPKLCEIFPKTNVFFLRNLLATKYRVEFYGYTLEDHAAEETFPVKVAEFLLMHYLMSPSKELLCMIKYLHAQDNNFLGCIELQSLKPNFAQLVAYLNPDEFSQIVESMPPNDTLNLIIQETARCDNIDLFKYFLSHANDNVTKEQLYETALHHVSTPKFLLFLMSDTNLNKKSSDGYNRNFLMSAIADNRLQVVKHVINNHHLMQCINLSQVDKDSRSTLSLLITSRLNKEELLTMLQSIFLTKEEPPTEDVSVPEKPEKTEKQSLLVPKYRTGLGLKTAALTIMATSRLKKIVPCSVDQRDNKGQTPLMFACDQLLPDVVKFLLSQNANPRVRDMYSRDAFAHCAQALTRLASSKSRVDGLSIAQILLSYDLDISGVPLAASIVAGEDIFQLVLNHDKLTGVNLNVPDIFGKTPLQIAAEMKSNMIVSALVKAGADVRDNVSVFHSILMFGTLDTVRLLLNSGAPVYERDPLTRRRALDIVTNLGNVDVQKLVEHAAIIQLEEKPGKCSKWLNSILFLWNKSKLIRVGLYILLTIAQVLLFALKNGETLINAANNLYNQFKNDTRL